MNPSILSTSVEALDSIIINWFLIFSSSSSSSNSASNFFWSVGLSNPSDDAEISSSCLSALARSNCFALSATSGSYLLLFEFWSFIYKTFSFRNCFFFHSSCCFLTWSGSASRMYSGFVFGFLFLMISLLPSSESSMVPSNCRWFWISYSRE